MKLKPLLCLMTGTLFAFNAPAEPIAVGAKIPEVTSIDETGQPIELGKAAATGWTLVYFYPKADTPGCTAQACSLRDAFSELQGKGVRVFGVSADKPEAQKKFKEKYQLPFTLLADSEKKVINAFGVPLNAGGMANRQAFLFKDGQLVWRDLKAKTKEQAQDILKAIGQTQPAA